jgi:hypothetical protein
MHAIHASDFITQLETDLREGDEVILRYRKDGEEKSEVLSHSSCRPQVEIVTRAFVEVTPCNCSYCRGLEEDEPAPTVVIPVDDIVDVKVDGIEADIDGFDYIPKARWSWFSGLLRRYRCVFD